MRLIFSRRETYTGQRPPAGTLNFGSGAALASWALERVRLCQLCLIYFWIARSCSADALSAADSDDAKGVEISKRIVMSERKCILALGFSVILIFLLEAVVLPALDLSLGEKKANFALPNVA